ncbi:Uncharacterised protein [Rodentibacter pneumotropicus]|uniref:Uncharacterized protein n=1 Tax=Rodentibacter pneumotropicus TaxID=758 RepID=A0A448MK67_9PAST|nr:Uncharacterised protein [Rodentibacter pneumotropicus]
MAIYYKDGFFNDDFGGFVPEDAVEISEENMLNCWKGRQKENKSLGIVPETLF